MLSKFKHCLIIVVTLSVLAANGTVLAFGSGAAPVQGLRHQQALPSDSVLMPLLRSQNAQSDYRSRSEVMREVKRRYDAKVLKISLNKQREVYNVRLLMPNGKVRNIQVSARR